MKPRDPAERKRSDAHSDKILAMLIAAGRQGCTNLELWDPKGAGCGAIGSHP